MGSDVGDRILVVGLGNPGTKYAKTRHNLGFEVVAELTRRWELPKAKEKFRGLLTEGRIRPGGPRVAALLPQTFMNESGNSVGPARGQLRVPLERIVVVYDEIDLPFGEVRSKLGGGTAGHNGMKALQPRPGQRRFLARQGRRGTAGLHRPGGRLRLGPRPLLGAGRRCPGADLGGCRRDRAVGRAASVRRSR